MPSIITVTHVERELAFEHSGIRVWKSYKCGQPLTYWFGMTGDDSELGDDEIGPLDFDVRLLPAWLLPEVAFDRPTEDRIADTIRRSVDAGLLREGAVPLLGRQHLP
jgi:hypothetical protein